MKFRKVLFWIHFAAGIIAGGVIFSMAVSGILLSFEPQIVEWVERDRRIAAPAPDATSLSLDELMAKAADASPQRRPSAVMVKSDPSASVVVSFGKEGGRLYLDPYTGAILGRDSKTHDFFQAVLEWHRWLGSRKIGQPVTGAACLFFFFLLLSGLYLWWPRKRSRAVFRSVTVPNLKLKGKARDWNWHNTVGFWAAPMLLVTTLTGTVIAYRWAGDLLFVMTGNAPPPKPQEDKVDSGKQPESRKSTPAPSGGAPVASRMAQLPTASLDSMLARVKGKASKWASITLRFPRKPGAPVTAHIQEPGFWRRNVRSQIDVNASTSEIFKWEHYSDQNLGRKMRAWIVPIHTGRALDVLGQCIACLAAAAAALQVWTGMALAWRRFFQSRPKISSVDAAAMGFERAHQREIG